MKFPLAFNSKLAYDGSMMKERVMTEAQIERIVEREMDKLDRLLLAGQLSYEDYDFEITELEKWAREEYRANRGN